MMSGLNDSLIVLLLKEDTNSLSMDAYRPIALLNQDYTFLANILASRLAIHLPTLIHQDQQCCIKGRSTFSSTSTVVTMLYNRPIMLQLEGIMAFDFRKAFDSVRWDYLWAVLGKFGLGRPYDQMIQALYTSPKARVRTNNILSVPF